MRVEGAPQSNSQFEVTGQVKVLGNASQDFPEAIIKLIASQVSDALDVHDSTGVHLGGLGPNGELVQAIGVATGAAGAETLNAVAGIITTEALSTAGATDFSRTLTNSKIGAGSIVLVIGIGGSNTTSFHVVKAVPAAGSCTITFRNATSATALNGTIKYAFLVINPVG